VPANWLVEATAGTKAAFPANASVAAANPTVVTATNGQQIPGQQIVASFTGKISVAVPALTQSALTTLKFQIPLSTFPSSFKVAPSTSALVQANIGLAASPGDATTQVHTIALGLSLLSGGSQVQGAAGQWTLPPGTYGSPALDVSVGVSSTVANIAGQTLTFLANAQMNQTASTVAPTPTVTPGVTATTSSAPTPTQTPQVAVVTLSGGSVVWTYPIPYAAGSVPVVVATAIGAPGTTGVADLYLTFIGGSSVTINSRYNMDNRQVCVYAFNPPS
jgi:hypothetical protein